MGLLVGFPLQRQLGQTGRIVAVPWYGYTTIGDALDGAARLHEEDAIQSWSAAARGRHGPNRQRNHPRHADSPLRQRRSANLRNNHVVTGSRLDEDLGMLLKQQSRGSREINPTKSDRDAHRSRKRSDGPVATSS